jgi:S1-C subfamily serine protease
VAAQAGLAPGDVILEINRQELRTPEQARNILRQAKGTILLVVTRDDTTRYVLLRR